MRIALSFFIIFLLCSKVGAQIPPPEYITAGEMYYTYQGMQNGEHVYRVTMQSFAKCDDAPHKGSITISIYDRGTNVLVKRVNAPLNTKAIENFPGDLQNNCIVNPPSLCNIVATYSADISLPSSTNGYLLSCAPAGPHYRAETIANFSWSNLVLATYTAEIPGGDAAANSTFQISSENLVVSCANSKFLYNFGTTDYDGDELRYYLCNAYQAGLNADNNLSPSAPPPFQSVPYAANFSGIAPLGANVTFDEKSGVMTGVTPAAGFYVVTICVGEYRNGVLIATQRKEVMINVTSCQVTKASLLPEYLLCKDNSTLELSNLSSPFRVEQFEWQISSSDGSVLYTGNKPTVSYTFKDTGVYNIKLAINKDVNECKDSTTSIVKVYPGLKPDFNVAGFCATKPTSLTNTSTASLGQINYWKWDFGDEVVGNAGYSIPDVTGEYSPSYQYQSSGSKQVQLVIGSTYGCRDTLRRTIKIAPKPSLTIVNKDPVVCLGDTTELWAFASGGGNLTWTPQTNMVNGNSDKPLVSPTVTTVYYVLLDKDGCQNKDSVKVRLTNKVFVQAMNDTTICQGDSIRLKLSSDGDKYFWTNVSPEKATLANPSVITNETTAYEVTASIGSCSAKDTVRVITVPYPAVNAGADMMICDEASALLAGSTDGSSFTWSFEPTLSHLEILTPIATPEITTNYVLTAYDNKGCPKPSSDTVLVTVLPPIQPFAGRDTTALVGIPIQLNATGGVSYEWSPAIGLSANNIRNPVATYSSPSAGIKYKVRIINEAGCADSAYINVTVFAVKPQVFVPTAFTPNGDGRNDVLRPIAAGIKVEYFNVYNRWGQLVFSTKTSGQGWDGTIGKQLQVTGVYTWVVKAIGIDGKPYFEKGTVTLIR